MPPHLPDIDASITKRCSTSGTCKVASRISPKSHPTPHQLNHIPDVSTEKPSGFSLLTQNEMTKKKTDTLPPPPQNKWEILSVPLFMSLYVVSMLGEILMTTISWMKYMVCFWMQFLSDQVGMT